MTNPIGLLGTAVSSIAPAVADHAAQILRKACPVPGAPDLRQVANDVVDIAATQPGHAADVLEAMRPQLAPREREQLARDMGDAANTKRKQSQGDAPSATRLALDTVQLALCVAGIVDPTPTCDAIDGVISLLRGDYAGAAISVLSMIPYVGDVAKVGKLGKLADTASDAVALARRAPGAADATSGAQRAVMRIADLLPNPPCKVMTDDDRIVKEMLQQGQQLKRDDALERLAPTSRDAGTEAVAPQRNALPAQFIDGPSAPPEKLVFRNADQLLAHFGLERIADNPDHAALWRAAHDAVTKPGYNNPYTRALDKLAAGVELSKDDARSAFSYVRKHFGGLFEAQYGFKPADVEHVVNLARKPELALDPRNLSVTRSERELNTKVHELLHWIKSGGDSVNKPGVWWLQVYGKATDRFDAMTDAEVRQAVQELLDGYGVKK